MYMEDVKFFVKSKNKLETLIQRVGIFHLDIIMGFRIEKWAMFTIGEKETEEIKRPNQESIKTIGEKCPVSGSTLENRYTISLQTH